MVTQTVTTQAEPAERAAPTVKSITAEIRCSELSRRAVNRILTKAEQQSPSERQLVVVELAVTLWQKSLEPRGPLYPGFEAFIRSSLSGRGNVEEYVRPLIDTGRIYDDAMAMYSAYLQEMFEASGKTRSQFYDEMLAETGIQMNMEDADFGLKAENFFKDVVGTLHEHHLLVFYSVKLVLRLYRAACPSSSTQMAAEKLDLAYKYFERGIPLGETFLDYAKDDIFLRGSLEHGCLSEIK